MQVASPAFFGETYSKLLLLYRQTAVVQAWPLMGVPRPAADSEARYHFFAMRMRRETHCVSITCNQDGFFIIAPNVNPATNHSRSAAETDDAGTSGRGRVAVVE